MYSLKIRELGNKSGAGEKTMMIDDTKTKTITESIEFLLQDPKIKKFNIGHPSRDMKMHPSVIKIVQFSSLQKKSIEGQARTRLIQYVGVVTKIKVDLEVDDNEK